MHVATQLAERCMKIENIMNHELTFGVQIALELVLHSC